MGARGTLTVSTSLGRPSKPPGARWIRGRATIVRTTLFFMGPAADDKNKTATIQLVAVFVRQGGMTRNYAKIAEEFYPGSGRIFLSCSFLFITCCSPRNHPAPAQHFSFRHDVPTVSFWGDICQGEIRRYAIRLTIKISCSKSTFADRKVFSVAFALRQNATGESTLSSPKRDVPAGRGKGIYGSA